MKTITVGSFEVVSMPDIGLKEVVAKVDTGAYSGAVHCTSIKVVRRGMKRKRILKFVPADNENLKQETEHFTKKKVRSSNGKLVSRYLIDTNIEVKGICYPVTIGITDRSDMKKQILIGRKFLRQNNMLVDVRVNADYDDDEGEKS